MKKLCIAIALSLVLVTALVAFAACDGTSTEPTYYDITLNSGDNFSVVCSHKNAKAGENVTLTVTAGEFFEIDTVTANGTACTLNTSGKYEFTMPAQNVTVSVTLKASPDMDESDTMVWSKVCEQLAAVEDGDDTIYTSQTFEVDFGTYGVTNTTNVEGYMTEVEIYSLNPDVIPNEAISGAKATTVVNGWYATGATFDIDLTKISEGTARLVFKEGTRALVKTLEVVDFGEVTPENLYTEKVIVDMSELKGEYENLRIWITDNDYQIGSVYKETQFVDFVYSAENTFEYEFRFTPEHEFTIAVGYEYYDEDRQMYLYKNFAIMNIVLPGAEAGFFTGIITDSDTGSYIISYVADNMSLTAVLIDE